MIKELGEMVCDQLEAARREMMEERFARASTKNELGRTAAIHRPDRWQQGRPSLTAIPRRMHRISSDLRS